MSFKPKVFLSDFIRAIELAFNDPLRASEPLHSTRIRDVAAYVIAVGEVLKDYDNTVLASQPVDGTDDTWNVWMLQAKEGLDLHNTGTKGNVLKFNTKRFNEFQRTSKKVSPAHAFAAHYRLHMHLEEEELKYADALDLQVFGYVFRKRRGPLFDYSPDQLYHAPPLTAPMDYPDYLTEREVAGALAQNADDGIWLNPHNHFTIPLAGRESEKKRLTDFVEDPAPFRICPVIGPSGAGKTRLISEWMKPYVATFNPDIETESSLNSTKAPLQKWGDYRSTLLVALNKSRNVRSSRVLYR